MTTSTDLIVQVRTARCQPWCHTHHLDTTEVHHYEGVPHYWHYAERVDVPGDEGKTFSFTLELFEPANDPLGFAPAISVTDSEVGYMALLESVPLTDARAIATGILELLDRPEANR